MRAGHGGWGACGVRCIRCVTALNCARLSNRYINVHLTQRLAPSAPATAWTVPSACPRVPVHGAPPSTSGRQPLSCLGARGSEAGGPLWSVGDSPPPTCLSAGDSTFFLLLEGALSFWRGLERGRWPMTGLSAQSTFCTRNLPDGRAPVGSLQARTEVEGAPGEAITDHCLSGIF